SRKGGTVMQAGLGKEAMAFPIMAVCTKVLVVRGSIRYTAGCYPAAVELISQGKIDAKKSIMNRFKFEEAEKASELVKEGYDSRCTVKRTGVE
ncbi:hypothetical protein BDY21DRAFT_276765, partial [Lineolata rhizophorae]